jgi:hypothetical protein
MFSRLPFMPSPPKGDVEGSPARRLRMNLDDWSPRNESPNDLAQQQQQQQQQQGVAAPRQPPDYATYRANLLSAPSATEKRRPIILPLEGAVRDGAAAGVVIGVRLVRVMVLWIAYYFVDRAYQASFVQRTVVDGEEPPALWTIPIAAFAIEAAIFALVLGMLFLLKARFKTPTNTFVIDGPLLSRLAADYALTTAVSLAVCGGTGLVAQDRRHFRYRDDGLRGIRAASLLMFVESAAIVALL